VRADTGGQPYCRNYRADARSLTPQILALPERYRTTATFGVVGSQVAANRALVAEVAAAGHAIANHTGFQQHRPCNQRICRSGGSRFAAARRRCRACDLHIRWCVRGER
jgi:hypothetical protein